MLLGSLALGCSPGRVPQGWTESGHLTLCCLHRLRMPLPSVNSSAGWRKRLVLTLVEHVAVEHSKISTDLNTTVASWGSDGLRLWLVLVFSLALCSVTSCIYILINSVGKKDIPSLWLLYAREWNFIGRKSVPS